MNRVFLTGIIIVLLSPLVSGQSINPDLNLIPVPKQIEMKPGSFEFPRDIQIRVKDQNNIGLEDFTELLKTELGISVKLHGKGPGKSIRIEKRKDIGFKAGAEGYLLAVKPEGITVAAPTEAGIFYGMQTLSQLITANRSGRAVPCVIIRDYPDIPVRGWQDDISRGPIPTLDFLKKEVRTLAAFKLNAMTLYTEHVFKLKKHPSLAPEDGITEEQIAGLSDYAARYHVQVIGNFQSFGHMEKILSKPGYQHLAENGHILTPTKEESYQFMKEVYSEVVPAYSSPYFNINCDETFGLGEGLSKKMADSIGIEGIYGYHINRLNNLLKPYHKRILMWGDITSNPKIVALLPKDITVISWGYHAAASFDYAIKPFSDQGLNFWVAPGVSCWGNVFPNLQVASININNYIRDGYKLGATGVLNTSWMDDGLSFFENNWYGLVWGAEKSWNAPQQGHEVNSEQRQTVPAFAGMTEKAAFAGTTSTLPGVGNFEKAFDKIFFGTTSQSVTSWMQAFSALHQGKVRDIARNSRFFEPVLPFYPEYVEDTQMDLNGNVLAKLDSLEALLPALKQEVVRNGIDLDYLDFALAEVRFTANKNLFRVQLYRYLKVMNGAISAESLKITLKILIRQSEQLKSRYAEFWKQVNRDWWLDRNMEKFEQLSHDLRNVRGLTILTIADTFSPAGRSVKMRSMLDNLPVYFTLDGTAPTVNSDKYSGPVYLKSDATIRARVIDEGKEFPETVDSLIMHKAIGKLYKLNSTWSNYHPAYGAGGRLGLVDGRTGSVKDIRSGRWQGYSGQDINVEIDFGKIDTLHSLSMGFYQTTFSWVILPKQLEISYSNDGINYQKYKTLYHNIPVDYPDPVTYRFEADLNNLKTRYLKVVGIYYGPLPEFHASKGEASMMFADEVIIH
ncbi:MAG: family 20 glycosylhydrolase [Bacteroidia bacterium]|nr:family 20 glycosylhydrolase [Bacteroidia bacterium]